jgi:hypothetical protein
MLADLDETPRQPAPPPGDGIRDGDKLFTFPIREVFGSLHEQPEQILLFLFKEDMFVHNDGS